MLFDVGFALFFQLFLFLNIDFRKLFGRRHKIPFDFKNTEEVCNFTEEKKY